MGSTRIKRSGHKTVIIRKMKRIIIIFFALAMTSCIWSGHISVPDTQEESPMQMNAMTRSVTDFGSGSPVFLFWLDNDFQNIGTQDAPTPYLVSWPYLGIDDYRPEIQTYNTGKRYPENDQEVCCTGYFPASLTVDGGAAARTWSSLSIEDEADLGILDVMVAPEHITGKSSAHFDDKRPKEPLEFIHAQSKVTFKAKMGTDMAQNRYLRNVQVTVPGKDQFMSTLKWENGRYIADGTTSSDDVKVVLKDPDMTQLDPNQLPRELGHVYIYPGMSSIYIEAQLEMDDSPLFSNPEMISVKTYVEFDFKDGISTVLRENDAYEIIIVINYDSIALRGRKCEWEEGGSITIPIYPNQ